MDKNKYDEGFRTGAGSTQDQARGARDAELERQRAAQEQQQAWDRIRQQQELDEQRRQQERRAQEEQQARSTQAANSGRAESGIHGKAAGSAGSSSGPRNFIAFVGLVGGAALGYQIAGDNLVAIGICAVVAGLIAYALYKLIIGVAVIAGIVFIWLEAQEKSPSQPTLPEPGLQVGSPVVPDSFAQPVSPVASSVAPSVLFKPGEFDLYVNPQNQDTYIFHGPRLSSVLSQAHYDWDSHRITLVGSDGAQFDLGIVVTPMLRPYLEREERLYVVQTKDGEAVDGVEIPLHKRQREGVTYSLTPLDPNVTLGITQGSLQK
jgi:hypothetical protein